MKYVITQGADVGFESTDYVQVLDHCHELADITRYDTSDDYFEEWVNDHYSGTTIEGEYYSPYDILSRFDDENLVLDEFRDYMLQSDYDNAEYDLRNARVGYDVYFQDFIITVQEEEAEEEEEEEVDYLASLRLKVSNDRAFVQNEKNEEEKSRNEYEQLFQRIGGS